MTAFSADRRHRESPATASGMRMNPPWLMLE